ncbi:hypothetical protein HN709_00495 [Candidatus Peregrinibacteria bacterium]|nr:hypothetical protein [Candidatus Peregrinibacteria bacterium]MBT7736147.1 hypothetical protein [Candidatus Peregrinibacteria bacterium]
MKKLILIDGNAVIHRAFHGLPPTFRTPEGELVNAVYGFSSILLNILNVEKPEYIAVSFDLAKKTFRHEEYKEYKATRKKAPDELYAQFARVKEVVKAFQIPIYEIEGFEADDVLGTLAKQAEKKEDIMTYIFTGDMDILQLVTERTNAMTPTKGLQPPKVYTPEEVVKKWGLKPSQVVDMKGLQGDSSDNIKGVPGIGPKTAQTLLQKYGDLEGIYKHLDKINGSVHDKLEKDKESAFFSRRLATIVTDVPMTLDLEECKTHEYDQDKIAELFLSLNFKSLLGRLTAFNNHSDTQKIEDSPTQQSLF